MDRIYSAGSFFAHFNFPEQHKRVCEQYLMYFGEFLADLGIDANTSIREYGSEVLFEVVPKNKDEAIEKIYHAFQMFLSLPKNSDQFLITPSEKLIGEVKIQQLLSVIDHLKGQLKVSNALVKIREAEISIIQRANESEVMEGSLIDMSGKLKEDKIYLFDETVAIKSYKGKWFDINLPKITKKIQTKFSRINPET
jgi:hypothetical protein